MFLLLFVSAIDVPVKTEELSIDVLPPQLEELVLNALQEIENNKLSADL